MIEKEFKILIDEQKYEQIKSLFNWSEVIDQNNYYYRLSEKYENDNITVRVREMDNKYTLQVKMPISNEKSLNIKKEYEEKLNNLPEVIITSQLYNLTGIILGEAFHIGSLRTQRHICFFDENTQLCLDKNFYLEKTDFEIEIEYIHSINEELKTILLDNGIHFDEEVCGKYTRFVNEYRRIK